MPLKQSSLKRKTRPPSEQEESTPAAMRSREEAAEPHPAELGRPHQAFVESESRKYWREMVKVGRLVKPDQGEMRVAAMPVLSWALRRRQGKVPDPALFHFRAHQGVSAMQLHAAERGWLKHPFTPSETSPDYVEALIQLADDANWIAREIPLLAHPEPYHPTIYYTTDQATNRPIPREDSVIRGDYVYRERNGRRFVENGDIYPWSEPRNIPTRTDLIDRGWTACYTLISDEKTVWINLHWLDPTGCLFFVHSIPLKLLHFSPHPPV